MCSRLWKRGNFKILANDSLHWCLHLFVFVCIVCLFLKRYNDKVDIWSIGALLYEVLVGKCGFYAVRTYFGFSAIIFIILVASFLN